MRLIDADVLKKRYTMVTKRYSGGIMECPAVLLESIDSAPTIDAVEVVRCKDCKHSEVLGKSLIRYCDHSIIPMIRDDDGYCSCGERREQ